MMQGLRSSSWRVRNGGIAFSRIHKRTEMLVGKVAQPWNCDHHQESCR